MKKKFLKYSVLFAVAALVIYSVSLNTGYNKAGEIMAGEGDSIFAGVQVHEIRMQFSQTNYWDSLIYFYNQGLEQYMLCDVTVNGVPKGNSGVRMKGNSSFTHPNNKKPFKISFNEYISGQRWNGLKSVSLGNCWNDPTFIREKLHLDLCRAAGIPAPRANFAKLYINDSLYGLYSLVESVDKTFMTQRYGDNSGIYFKAVDARDTGTQYFSDFCWYGNDSTPYFSRYELKSTEILTSWRKLVSYIDTLHHSTNIAASYPMYTNMSNLYKATAMDIMFGNLDAYMHSGRNFYVYYNPVNSKMEWIIWDVSLSIGAMPGGGISSIETLPLTYVIDSTQRPLLGKIFNTPTLKNEYLLALCNLHKTYFSTAVLFPKIDSIANIIRPEVYSDPRKMYTNQQFETNIISDITILGSRKPGLKSFVTLRANNIATQLNNLGINCETAVQPGQESIGNQYELKQNYPNPFNPTTKISYYLPKYTNISVRVYSLLGEEIATLVNNKNQNSGNYSVEWNGTDNNGRLVSSGIYLYVLETPYLKVSRKMTLLK